MYNGFWMVIQGNFLKVYGYEALCKRLNKLLENVNQNFFSNFLKMSSGSFILSFLIKNFQCYG